MSRIAIRTLAPVQTLSRDAMTRTTGGINFNEPGVYPVRRVCYLYRTRVGYRRVCYLYAR